MAKSKEELIAQLKEIAQLHEAQGLPTDKISELIDDITNDRKDTASVKIQTKVTVKKFDGDDTTKEPVEVIEKIGEI